MKRKKLIYGFILIDILTAFALAVLFIALITKSSFEMRDIYIYAKERGRLLDIYETHAGEFTNLMPMESRTLTFVTDGGDVNITGYARWYGNERIQTDINITNAIAGQGGTHINREPYHQSIQLLAVRSYPFANYDDVSGTPLCTVDLSKNSKSLNLTSILLPIDPTLPLTDLVVRNGIAYISTDSGKASDPDLFVLNIRDQKNSSIISSIDTGPGISSISLAGNHIFAAAASTAAQLHVIRFDNLISPILEKKYQLPLPFATSTSPMGKSIFYLKNKVYLGTEKWDGEEFSIIDVSKPTTPIRLSGFETNTQINDIYVRGYLAYITGSNRAQLNMIEVSNPTELFSLDTFEPSGWERQEGKVLEYFEGTLNMGRTSGGFNISKDHEAFSWATTSDYSLKTYNSADVRGGVYGIVIDRSHLYLATREIDKEFQIYDRDLSTTTVRSTSLPVLPQALVCDNDSLYILAHNSPVIYEIKNIR